MSEQATSQKQTDSWMDEAFDDYVDECLSMGRSPITISRVDFIAGMRWGLKHARQILKGEIDNGSNDE